MKTKSLVPICMLLIHSVGCDATESVLPETLASKVCAADGFQHPYELIRAPFTQTIETDDIVTTNKGTLLELRKQPAAGAPLGQGSTNLIWSMFVVKSLDPREKWTGDFAIGPGTGELFVAVSGGTSFAVYRVNVNQTAPRPPERVSTVMGQAESASVRSLVGRPSPDMLLSMPQIDKIRIGVEGDVLVIQVVSPEHRERLFRFSITTKQWLQ